MQPLKILNGCDMRNVAFVRSGANALLSMCVGAVLLAATCALATAPEKARPRLGNDEESFVFAGKCSSGEPYRLLAYQKNVSGLAQPFYDYDGPVGKGTVQSDSTPKVMAVRICRRMAEIVNTHYWE
jgi:hypothetical protein